MNTNGNNHPGLPERWTWCRIEEIAQINPRHPLHILPDNTEASFLPMPILNENNWKIKEMQTRLFGEIKKGYTHFAEGDVLFAKITPCMENGKAAIARNLVNRIGCGTTELHVIRPHGGIPPEFVYHYIHQESFRKEAEARMTGTAGQLRVPVDFVASSSIPIPPLQEQILIVSRIELLLERTRKAKESLEKIPRIMKRFRQAALKKALSGELTAEWRGQQQDLEPAAEFLKRITEERESYYQTMARQNQSKKLEKQDNEPLDTSELSELPEGWVWTKIEEIGQVKGGKRLPKGHELLEEKTPYPYIRAGNLKNGTVLTNQIMYVSEGTHKKIERYTISAKDVYITIVGACIGDVGVIPSSLEGANLTENAAKICELKNIDNKYIALAFSSSQIKNQIDENILSAAQGKLALFRIAKLCVPLPSLPEQQEIVHRIESLFKFADETEKNTAEARKRVEIMTQSILARAFRGDLSADFREAVKNWKDLNAEARGRYVFVLPEEEREKVLNANEFPMEPASRLLECIGEEKEKKVLKRRSTMTGKGRAK